MEIVLITNIINHYMLPWIEEMNLISGVNAYFVETTQLSDSFKKAGFLEYEDTSKIIRAWKDQESWNHAMNLAITADVMIIGAAGVPREFERRRLRKGLLTFEHSERPLKKGLINLLSPRILNAQLHYHIYRKKPLYMLCFSAFTAHDEYLMHSYKGRCFRFGYLPRINHFDITDRLEKKKGKKIRFIWCARFISWKHPELVVLLAEKLARDGYDFEINMIGSGVLFNDIKEMIDGKGLGKYVHLLGNYPNPEVLNIMSEHHIFLFTSDKQEGWGVVLNEAMGQGCCPIASNEIGATPYLLSHQENGLIFQSRNLDSLYHNTKYLLDNTNMIEVFSVKAYETVSKLWNPQIVAERFVNLCHSLLRGEPTIYKKGPCSIALSGDCKINL